MEAVVAFLITVVVVVYLTSPFLFPLNEALEELPDEAIRSLNDQRERCLQVLKDLELDYSMQKVSEHEYEDTKQLVSRELAGVLTQLDDA